jgi:hypothetical protein
MAIINNEGTKQQIRIWIERAIAKAQNPDPREAIKKKRAERVKTVAKSYGF